MSCSRLQYSDIRLTGNVGLGWALFLCSRLQYSDIRLTGNVGLVGRCFMFMSPILGSPVKLGLVVCYR